MPPLPTRSGLAAVFEESSTPDSVGKGGTHASQETGALGRLCPPYGLQGGLIDATRLLSFRPATQEFGRNIMRARKVGLAGLLATTTLGFAGSAMAAETTYQRLLNSSSEPQNWLMRMGNYSNWNNSSLNQINRSNVAKLKVKLMASLADPTRPNKATQYFTPIV